MSISGQNLSIVIVTLKSEKVIYKCINSINKNIPIINLAWHISKEIKYYLKNLGIKNRIIDIVQKKDFKI